jgi:hypothetical protein
MKAADRFAHVSAVHWVNVATRADMHAYILTLLRWESIKNSIVELARVHARAWERLSDTFVDPIFVDISDWKWAERPDQMPQGLLDAPRADLRAVYTALEHDRDFISGTLSVADTALFPHSPAPRRSEFEGTSDRSDVYPQCEPIRFVAGLRNAVVCVELRVDQRAGCSAKHR